MVLSVFEAGKENLRSVFGENSLPVGFLDLWFYVLSIGERTVVI